MNSRNLSNLMWGEALSLLEQADRLHRQFFRPAAAQAPAWEPPVDVIETADTVAVHVALPGAAADSILVELEPGAITVSARRPLPLESDDRHPARVHALRFHTGALRAASACPCRR